METRKLKICDPKRKAIHRYVVYFRRRERKRKFVDIIAGKERVKEGYRERKGKVTHNLPNQPNKEAKRGKK